MRELLVSAFVFFSCLMPANSVFAVLSCPDPVVETLGKADSVYHFRATVKCELNESNIAISDLKHRYDRSFAIDPKYTIHSRDEEFTSGEYAGYKLDVTNAIDSGHGRMAIRYDIYLVDNQADKFVVQYHSKSINAEGDAKNTKYVMTHLIVQERGPESYGFTFLKETKIKKPWYAPEGMFEGTVKEEMSKELRAATQENLGRITGP